MKRRCRLEASLRVSVAKRTPLGAERGKSAPPQMGFWSLAAIFLSLVQGGTAASATVGLYTTQSPLFQAPNSMALSSSIAYYGFFQPRQIPGAVEMDELGQIASLQTSNAPFSTTYVTGGVRGIVFYDTLTVGDIRLPRQAMGLAEQESLDFALATCDGLFGLAFPSNNSQNLSMPFFSMLRAGILDQPVFSMWLNPNIFDGYAGELKFGVVDSKRYFGNMRWLDVMQDNGPRYWQLRLDGATMANANVSLKATSVILDSGSTLIFASQDDARAINLAIPGMQGDDSSGVYNLTNGCTSIGSLPPLGMTIAGLKVMLLPEQYILKRDGSSMCASAIVGVMDDPSYIVLGTPFLRAYYTAYQISDVNNLASAKIGIAAASGSGLSNVTSFLGL